MKGKDIIWGLIILLITSLIIIPATRTLYEDFTISFPYLSGFLKTAILATMGELLAKRIQTGNYFSGKGLAWRMLIWGLLGMGFVLAFKVFSTGVVSAQSSGLLPSVSTENFFQSLLTAFLISFIMNLFFAPAFMIFHKVTDTFIDLGSGDMRKIIRIGFSKVIETIDWKYFFTFVVLKTVPIFWIPAHTITFLLPENYRVLMAAYLSIVLGIILSLSKRTKVKKENKI